MCEYVYGWPTYAIYIRHVTNVVNIVRFLQIVRMNLYFSLKGMDWQIYKENSIKSAESICCCFPYKDSANTSPD